MPSNAVEREPVPTRVLNPNASKASYKPKQRSYRKTNLIFFSFFFGGILSGGFYPGTHSSTISMVSKEFMKGYRWGLYNPQNTM